MLDFLPRKRRARSGLRSPHATWWPWRTSNCAIREPVAPAPRTKIRMGESVGRPGCSSRYQKGLLRLLQPEQRDNRKNYCNYMKYNTFIRFPSRPMNDQGRHVENGG